MGWCWQEGHRVSSSVAFNTLQVGVGGSPFHGKLGDSKAGYQTSFFLEKGNKNEDCATRNMGDREKSQSLPN